LFHDEWNLANSGNHEAMSFRKIEEPLLAVDPEAQFGDPDE
jgi:hypothetical protein